MFFYSELRSHGPEIDGWDLDTLLPLHRILTCHRYFDSKMIEVPYQSIFDFSPSAEILLSSTDVVVKM